MASRSGVIGRFRAAILVMSTIRLVVSNAAADPDRFKAATVPSDAAMGVLYSKAAAKLLAVTSYEPTGKERAFLLQKNNTASIEIDEMPDVRENDRLDRPVDLADALARRGGLNSVSSSS